MAIYRTSVQIVSSSLGGNGANTWHARYDGSAELESATGSLNDMNDAIHQFYDAIGTGLASGTQINHDGLWSRVDEEDVQILTTPWASGPHGGGEPLPPQCCVVVGWSTAVPGRRRRGRTFLGPMGASVLQDNGTPEEAYREDVEDAAAALVTEFEGIADGALVVWSNLDEAAYDIVRGRVANRFGSLRSRRD